MNPYDALPRQHFWKASARLHGEVEVDFDYGRKIAFSGTDKFVTAGSCFAKHFGGHLSSRGARFHVAEERHPLVPENSDHGYGLFSARYGNIYTARHLRELLEQALGVRPVIFEFAKRGDGRWVDMLRPRAVPIGFLDVAHARADREFHLHAVRKMLEDMNVFIFTLGLTEAWVNAGNSYCYPVVPGAVAGEYIPGEHRFVNFSVANVVADLCRTFELIASVNRGARCLLTVSPVALVATAEARNVMVSTCASKSILRAAVDEVVRDHPAVDYFPSYEIITGPYGRGRYWAEGCREVTPEGVGIVMDVFFRSRLAELDSVSMMPSMPAQESPGTTVNATIAVALERECDEMFLDPSMRGRT